MFAIQASDGAARAGVLSLPHGQVATPVFMPVGTQGTVKALLPDQLERAGVEMLLGNTYHLHLRPGEDVVAGLGGLHEFMAWPGPLLTDSGGFQVFSLAALRSLTDDGAEFRSHIDGSLLTLTPEKATAIQNTLGADVIMAFDECVPYPCEREQAERAMRRTLAWAERCQKAHERPADQALFGIVQGSVFEALRVESARRLVDLGFPGYAIGGVSVGEGAELMYRAIDTVMPHLPPAAPRYVMGVGTPQNLLECIERGVDMFDCVMPSRNARGAGAFGPDGKLRLRNLQYREDARPIDESCDCYACRNFSRAYLRHMYMVREITASVLVSIHNVAFYMRLVRQARRAIIDGRFEAFKKAFLDRYDSEGNTNP
ncbi:tRNA guanosine(34) transglycosylase Tgt [bacterium]|nr:tRNA guanosine(34) transglycosylase Tgt [bacterium]